MPPKNIDYFLPCIPATFAFPAYIFSVTENAQLISLKREFIVSFLVLGFMQWVFVYTAASRSGDEGPELGNKAVFSMPQRSVSHGLVSTLQKQSFIF